VLGGVDDSLHFTVPSMNRLNKTEPATFSINVVLDFLWGLLLSLFMKQLNLKLAVLCMTTVAYAFTDSIS
jgi:hypothetical protein